jgi:hypothetical protein
MTMLLFHPLVAMFPPMKGEEFDELVGDIKRRGLLFPITTFEGQIIDGRNRAHACEKAGVEPRYALFQGSKEDIPRFIISANIHRRHLKPEQRRDLIKAILKLNPEASDRTVGTMAKADHKTVATVRKEQEATGEIPRLTKRLGRDGKKRKHPQVEIAGKQRGARKDNFPVEDDGINEDYDVGEPGQYREAFLMRADQAARFAVYSGPVTEEIVEAALTTVGRWIKLVDTLKRRMARQDGLARSS